jgi:hypothetical protein
MAQVTVKPYEYDKRISKMYQLPKGQTHTISGVTHVKTPYMVAYRIDRPHELYLGYTGEQALSLLKAAQ